MDQLSADNTMMRDAIKGSSPELNQNAAQGRDSALIDRSDQPKSSPVNHEEESKYSHQSSIPSHVLVRDESNSMAKAKKGKTKKKKVVRLVKDDRTSSSITRRNTPNDDIDHFLNEAATEGLKEAEKSKTGGTHDEISIED